MKKICIVTAARSEYGLLRWLIEDLSKSDAFELQLVVTGGHLLKSQGYTIDQILNDGDQVADIVNAGLDTSSEENIAGYMGRLGEGFAKTFAKLKPDYLMILGDRYELLPICSTALVMNIPIIHIGGGDITEGAIDDEVRNAVTMMAAYHFPGTEEAYNNIIRMRGSYKNVWVTGEVGLDVFNRISLMSRQELAENLHLNVSKKWILMTYHSETRQSKNYNLSAVKNILDVLNRLEGYQTVITFANADYGGMEINELSQTFVSKHGQNFKIIPSLGQHRYVSFMKQAAMVIGNSSSGILEAPFLHIPVVNVGNRQKGRYQCANITQCDINASSIQQAINHALEMEVDPADAFYWGDGHASEKIEQILMCI